MRDICDCMPNGKQRNISDEAVVVWDSYDDWHEWLMTDTWKNLLIVSLVIDWRIDWGLWGWKWKMRWWLKWLIDWLEWFGLWIVDERRTEGESTKHNVKGFLSKAKGAQQRAQVRVPTVPWGRKSCDFLYVTTPLKHLYYQGLHSLKIMGSC